VPTREQPTVVPPSSHEGLLLLLAILYTVVAVILITDGDSETPPRICARPGDDAELPGRLTERCHHDQGPLPLGEGPAHVSAGLATSWDGIVLQRGRAAGIAMTSHRSTGHAHRPRRAARRRSSCLAAQGLLWLSHHWWRRGAAGGSRTRNEARRSSRWLSRSTASRPATLEQ